MYFNGLDFEREINGSANFLRRRGYNFEPCKSSDWEHQKGLRNVSLIEGLDSYPKHFYGWYISGYCFSWE